MGFGFEDAFERQSKRVNTAATQAPGGYNGGKMRFPGPGTGLASALIVDGMVEALEPGHPPYRKSTYERHVGRRALERTGTKRWRKQVLDVIEIFRIALEPDDILLGDGNVR